MRRKKILTFYNIKQVCFDGIKEKSYSKSPLKPYLLLKKIKSDGYSDLLKVNNDFEPFTKKDFLLAHTRKYVDNMFAGKGNCISNSVPWSRNLIESLTYTNSSIYNSIKHSIENPDTVCFSPTSGFHHAQPNNGSGFCSFSGQVIASMKIYEEKGLVGCYFDLDGHYGNSIEDSRKFVKGLNKAIPKICNVNPMGKEEDYVNDLNWYLYTIGNLIRANKVHYIVWCHGADSHSDDDLGHQCNTKNWVKCSEIFYSWLKRLENELGRHIPLTLALFGGYRKDSYDSVLNLHMKDLIRCSNILLGNNFKDNLKVVKKEKFPTMSLVYKDSYDDEFIEDNPTKVERRPYKEWFKEMKNKKRLELFGTID